MSDNELDAAKLQALVERRADALVKMQKAALDLAKIDAEMVRLGGIACLTSVAGTIGATVAGTIGATVAGTIGATTAGTIGATTAGTIGATVAGTIGATDTKKK